MTEELVAQVVEERSLFELSPQGMVHRATTIANVLKNIIDKQQLYSNIQGKKYVKVEGWQAIGSMVGIVPKEKVVTELPDGSYLAEVELLNVKTGLVVGGASSLCSVDEKRWGSADKFARRSMAITRAVGKSYRLTFGWVMSMAGYETTPHEEMPEEVFNNAPQVTKQVPPVEQKPAAKTQAKPSGGAISAAQLKRLFAIASSKGWASDQVKAVCQKAFGCEPKDMHWKDYAGFVSTIEAKSYEEVMGEAADFDIPPPTEQDILASDQIPF